MCGRAFRGASLTIYGTDSGGLGKKIRHAPGLAGDWNMEAHRAWTPPTAAKPIKRTKGTRS